MTRLAVAVLLVIAFAASATAQTRLDLSGTTSLSQSVDPGRFAITIDNRLPQARYGVALKRELIPIAAIPVGPIGALGGFGPEHAVVTCTTLAEATGELNDASEESQVPARKALVKALLDANSCNDITTVTAARSLLAATEIPIGPIDLRDGERLIVTVTRQTSDGKTLTWTLTLETESRGEWLTSFGVSFLPDTDKRYNTEAAEAGKFTIVEETNDRALRPPTPSVYFTWLSSKQKRRNWSVSPTVGFGLDETSAAVFAGAAFTFNQNISFIGGLALAGRKVLDGRYTAGQEIGENLNDDQLHEVDFRPAASFAITVRFDRNPFKKDDPKPETPAETPPASVAPSTPASPAPGTSGEDATPSTVPDTATAAPEASREPDLALRFDSRGQLLDPSSAATLIERARLSTDVFIVSHGWWNDESAADCFYRRMIGGITASAPGYLTADRYRPLFVTVYWPSALFPLEPSDCAASGPTESTSAGGFTQERVRSWAAHAFPDAVSRATFSAEAARTTALLEAERIGTLSDAQGEELVSILVNWRGAADAGGEGAEPGAFNGSAHDIAVAWNQRSDSRSEFSLGDALSPKKWLNFGNAFTFWTMKQRAGVVGSTGLYAVVKALQPLRAQKMRLHLIGHSFGGKLVTASLVGAAGTAPNHADSLVILQGAFSQFAFATRAQIAAAGVRVDRDGLYRDALLSKLVTGPIVATHSAADSPNKLLYPLGVAVVDDVTEASRAPRYGSLGANGIRAVEATPLVLKQKRLSDVDGNVRSVTVDASGVIGGHSDLAKPQVFTLIWDAVEHDR